ncbi:MAG: TerC family protein, partial [Anaerovorax sp.]
EHFLVKIDGVRHLTPLFAVVVLIECTDIMFAIDSIPAVFAITTDPFIVYTSNIFAILGLRSLFFVLEALYEKFKYLKYGIATLLMFTGVKLCGLMFDFHISTPVSIGIILLIIVASILVSLAVSKHEEKKQGKKSESK